MRMRIGGLQKVTLLDYPGKVACTVFLPGCNLRCPFCHNGGLVLGGLPKVSRSINWVRVAQRFPVKIMVDKPDPEMFRIGASAVANLEPQ